MNENSEEYISIINTQLNVKKGDENLEELEKLFETEEFIEKIRSQRVDLYIKKHGKHNKYNKQVVKFLLGELGVLLQEEDSENENIEFFYYYLKEKKAKIELLKVFLIMMSIYLGLIAITQWHNVDFLMLHAAPSKDKVCRVMKSRYYLDVNPNNIYAECRPNDNNKTNDFYYKKVVYYISMMDENSEINFTCSWIPFHGITSDYEMALINEYFEEQSINVIESSLYERNYDGELLVNIENAEDKEVFMKQFKNAMENILSNNYLREWFTTIEFTIWLEEAVHGDWVQVYFDVYFDDNIAEVLDKLSDDLNVYLR